MDDSITVFKVGQCVSIGEDIDGRVRAVCIMAGRHITYEIIWWNGREHKTEWFQEFEIVVKGGHPATVEVGFHA